MDNEFSRLLSIEGIYPDKPRVEDISATAQECMALAQRLDLRHLSDLRARVTVRRVAGGQSLQVKGAFEAKVVQECVVSLQDVHDHISGTFETFFSEQSRHDREIDFTPEDSENNAEIIENGQIDLGEVVTQYLSLELDPYPRAPGVHMPAQAQATGTDGRPNPFLALKNMQLTAGNDD